MRYKPLALRVLSTAAMLSIVASCAAPAFAATYDLNNGDVSVSAESDGKQYVSQWTNDKHTQYAHNDKGEDINHLEDNNVTLTSKGEETKNTITVSAEKNQEAKVTLDDANIDTREDKSDPYTGGDAAMVVKGAGDVTLELDGNNVLTSGLRNAGLQKNDSDSTGTLTIQDSNNTEGVLTANGGLQAAGIGGSLSEDGLAHGTTNITITGGNITANGGMYAAGIGSSHTYPTNEVKNNVSDITITGGSINATGGAGGAGIGSGYNSIGDVSGIHISGIKNSTITGGTLAAAIGGGIYQDPNTADSHKAGTVSDIKITDSDITIVAGGSGTGIGTGYGHNISKDSVTIAGNSHIVIQQSQNFQVTYPNGTYIGIGSDINRNPGANYAPWNGIEFEPDFPCLVPGSLTYKDKDGTVVKAITGKGHPWDDGVVTTPASCFTDGVMTYTCTKCGVVKTEVIPAKGAHTWGEWETVKEATTTEAGLRQRVCSVCGAVEQEEIPMLTPAVPTTPTTPAAPTAPAAPTVPAAENTSAPELRVLAPDSIPQTFTVKQSGTVRTYESPYNSGTLTGTMETLEYLQEQGAQTIVFTTNQRTSSFQISELLALVNEGDVFYLNHMDANEPTLLVVANDHSELLG